MMSDLRGAVANWLRKREAYIANQHAAFTRISAVQNLNIPMW